MSRNEVCERLMFGCPLPSVRAANISSLVFTANLHKSALPHFAGPIMQQNWQFAVKWRPNHDSVKITSFQTKIFVFAFSRKFHENFEKIVEKTKIAAKRNFVKISPFSHDFRVFTKIDKFIFVSTLLKTLPVHLPEHLRMDYRYCTARSLKTSDF
jgi:hypothetical protein